MSERLSAKRPGVARIRTAVPSLFPQFLSRSRLISRLDSAADDAVVLVSASAGYGKTLLLADWTSRHRERTAWLTLDGEDNDDRRFWAAVLAALTTCSAVPPDSALRTLPLPADPSRHASFLPSLIDALEAVPDPITLVLDDVHEITAVDPLHGLTALIRDRPPRLRVVLSSRSDPPLRLSRLRLSGELVELRAPALALSLEETITVFAAAEVHLTGAQMKILHEQTEGWAAGLRLAAVSLRDADDTDLFLTDLVGNGRAISDYLVGEILARLPAETVDVLRAVSVCDQLTAPLAVAVSGIAAAGDVLASLERETSLLMSYGTGRQWFRIHPLLRAQLRADLQRRQPDLVAVLHERAARWCASAPALGDALRHAGLTGKPPVLVEMLHDHGVMLAVSGHHGAVCAALEGLGTLRADPHLLLVAVLAHLELGQPAAADRFLDDVERCWPAEPTAELESLRDIARTRRARHGATWSERGVPDPATATGGEQPDTDARDLDVVDMRLRADVAMSRGLLREAERLAQAAVDRAGREGNAYQAARGMVTLGAVAGLRGDVTRMMLLAERAEHTAPADVWRHTAGEVHALTLRACGALLRADPHACLWWASVVDDAAGAIPEAGRARIAALVTLLGPVRAAARFDLGEHRTGLDAMRTARAQLPPPRSLDGSVVGMVALLEHGAATRLGLGVHVHAVLEWAQERLGDNGDIAYLRAAAAARTGRTDNAARAHLRPLLDGVVVPAAPWTTIEAWLLDCVIAMRAGNRPRARHAVAQALAVTGATGVLRPLTAAPAEVADLIVAQLGSLGDAEPVAQEVLAVRRSRGGAPEGMGPAVSLTERERAVLDHLPSLLSLKEIAQTMSVTVNTVKTHMAAIYGKLDVHSRRDAVSAAHRARLIGPGLAIGSPR